MAMQQDKDFNARDINPILPDMQVPVSVTTRLRELQFPYPSAENMVFVFEAFVGGVTGTKQPDITIKFTADPQPGNPPEDVVDDDGNVVVAANAYSAPIPGIGQLRGMPLPGGPVSVTTFGDLFDVSRHAIYLAVMTLNPNWADAVED